MLQQRIQQQQAPPQATHVQLSVAEELAVIRAQSLRFRDSRKGIELERLELARQLQHLRQRHGHQLSVLHNLKDGNSAWHARLQAHSNECGPRFRTEMQKIKEHLDNLEGRLEAAAAIGQTGPAVLEAAVAQHGQLLNNKLHIVDKMQQIELTGQEEQRSHAAELADTAQQSSESMRTLVTETVRVQAENDKLASQLLENQRQETLVEAEHAAEQERLVSATASETEWQNQVVAAQEALARGEQDLVAFTAQMWQLEETTQQVKADHQAARHALEDELMQAQARHDGVADNISALERELALCSTKMQANEQDCQQLQRDREHGQTCISEAQKQLTEVSAQETTMQGDLQTAVSLVHQNQQKMTTIISAREKELDNQTVKHLELQDTLKAAEHKLATITQAKALAERDKAFQQERANKAAEELRQALATCAHSEAKEQARLDALRTQLAAIEAEITALELQKQDLVEQAHGTGAESASKEQHDQRRKKLAAQQAVATVLFAQLQVQQQECRQQEEYLVALEEEAHKLPSCTEQKAALQRAKQATDGTQALVHDLLQDLATLQKMQAKTSQQQAELAAAEEQATVLETKIVAMEQDLAARDAQVGGEIQSALEDFQHYSRDVLAVVEMEIAQLRASCVPPAINTTTSVLKPAAPVTLGWKDKKKELPLPALAAVPVPVEATTKVKLPRTSKPVSLPRRPTTPFTPKSVAKGTSASTPFDDYSELDPVHPLT